MINVSYIEVSVKIGTPESLVFCALSTARKSKLLENVTFRKPDLFPSSGVHLMC
jgi:hypothetical protein